jgi:hypothetical protein
MLSKNYMTNMVNKKNKGFGKSKQKPINELKLKGDYSFKVSIQSDIVDSWVTCKVINIKTEQEATVAFYLYAKNGMACAEVAMKKVDMYRDGWIGDSIDDISPMVCRAVLSIE